MKLNNKHRFIRNLLTLLLIIPPLLLTYSSASAAENCSDKYYINETLPNGARWDMCWEHRIREGIVFRYIYYTPKGGQRRMVLNHAAVAQIHVPYDDNGARYHDISDYGIGGSNMLNLQTDECPSGNLLKFGGKNVLCKQIEKRDFAYKSGNNTSKGHNLSLFSVSPVGAYYYIPVWRFMDDGTIEPWIGATGALQRFGGNQSRGWELGDGRTGISHLHNFFWKLDFDLNKSHKNDIVEEINFPLVNGKRKRTITTFNNEASRTVNPDTMRRWRVRDKDAKNSNNHNISYDIVLGDTGHQDIGPASEPFTHNDFYVTKQNDEEKFASHNPSSAKNLAEFANGESIANQDIVIWTGVTFYHMPRSEDAPHMDAHWSHMQIIPRDWHASNPLGSTSTNTPPTINTPSDQTSQKGVAVTLTIEASDINGDSLTYSASGLPNGLSLDKNTGIISGSPTSPGNNTVAISAYDGTSSSGAQFSWTITTTATNQAPQLNTPANQSGNVGDAINFAIQANDADGDTLSYNATGLPDGLQIGNNSGVISGNLSTAGNYTVSLTVSDSQDSVTSQFSWTVSSPSGSVSNQVSSNAISINGSLEDWSGLTFYASDPADVSGSTNHIDWLKVAIAHNAENVYFAYQNRQSIDSNNSSGSYIPWGWQAYLDTDNNSATGYRIGNIGADYIIEGSDIQRYIGTGSSWSWDDPSNAQVHFNGKNAELSFSRAVIGNPQNMRVLFEGNNTAIGGTSIDRYPNSGFFNYAFTGNSNQNTAPTASDQSISVGSGASVSLVLDASDVDNDSLTYQITQQPAHGSLSGSAPNLVFTANDNFTGSDSFTFKVNDGSTDSASATVSINITPGQSNGAISNFRSTPININGDDSDWSGLTRFDSDPDEASSVIDWRSLAFAHDDQTLYILYDSFNNIDPNSNSGSYLAWGWQVFIDVDKDASTGYKTGEIGADFAIEGDQIQRYTGTGDNWSWQHTGSLETRYSGNIAELSLPRSQIGESPSIRVVFQGKSEAYQGTGIDYYPNGQNHSQASLKYFEYDFAGDNGSNTRPIAYAQTVSNTSGSSTNISLIATAPNNNTLRYQVTTYPQHGTLSGTDSDISSALNNDTVSSTTHNVTYTSNSGFIGQDSFSFKVNNGSSDSATVTVTINVTGISDGVYSNPVSTVNIDGNNQEWSNVTAFTSDPDDVSGTNNIINWKSAAVAHNANSLYFMYQNYGDINPDNNSGQYISWGWRTFIDTDRSPETGYKVSNQVGADYMIEGGILQKYTGTGNNWSWDIIEETSLRYNADIAELSFVRSKIGNPSKFRVAFQGNNTTSTGTTVDNYPDNLSYFEYELSGGFQRSLNRPVAKSQTINIDANNTQNIKLSATDEDDDSLSFRIVQQPSHGTLSDIDGSENTLSYQPDTNYSGTDIFRFIANDGTFDSSVSSVRINIGGNGSNNSGSNNNNTNNGNSSESGGSSGSGGSIPPEWLALFAIIMIIRKHFTMIKNV